jgi:hypothetical protein
VCGICGKTGHVDAKCNRSAVAIEGGFPCETCGRVLRDEQGLIDHCNDKHDAGIAKAPKAPSTKACLNCGEVGHLRRDCPSDPQCNACGATDHVKADCPHAEAECPVCGKTGHLEAKCRKTTPPPQEVTGLAQEVAQE